MTAEDTNQLTHAFPFFELTKSATSRLTARFGSIFCGSQALSDVSQRKIARSERAMDEQIYRCSTLLAVSFKTPNRSRARYPPAYLAEAASII